MDEAIVSRYWCYMCSQMVNPVMEMEIKCPFCQSGFIEEMNNGTRDSPTPETDSDLGSDRALSLWAPILLGMMENPRRRRRFRLADLDDEENDDENEDPRRGLDAELDSIMRRRRRSSATILQLLQGIRAGMASESENSETDRERERVILINPRNQTIIVQGLYGSSEGGENQRSSVGSLGDYFIGPGLDLFLQHLAENDPNRYGTPPAQKEAVEAMPTVEVKENLQCSVCLDDFGIGTEAKEMPCKHKFHSGCILPWLELHSSCPVCRYQLPADESKLDSERSRNNNTNTNQRDPENNVDENVEESEPEVRSGNGRRFSIPWPFSLFSSSNSNSSSTSTSTSSSSPSGSPSEANEN